jgi:hypothetical protein
MWSKMLSFEPRLWSAKGPAGGYEQPVAPRVSETNIGAVLGQADHSDGCDHLCAHPRSRPDIAVDIGTNAVGYSERILRGGAPGPRPTPSSASAWSASERRSTSKRGAFTATA